MDITSLLANIDENILYIICAAVVCLILLTLFFLKSKSGSKDKNKPQEKNKKPKKRNVKKHQKKLKIPKYVQDTIPYINVYPDNGLIETEQGVFTKSYELKDINYQIAKEIEQEDMFVKYGEFLNAFDSNVNVQIVINNRNINQESFEAVTLLPPKGDGHDDLREEYNEMLLQKMSEA